MIPIQRIPAPDELTQELEHCKTKVTTWVAEGKTVRDVWSNGAKVAKCRIRQLLEEMAPGRKRCMYCEDNLGTDIDHFQPIALAPSRAFDWLNHLLACSYCNSNLKRDAYPCDEDTGEPLLIDPTAEDPADHLTLRLGSCQYEAGTRKGTETVRVFGLNDRQELVRGRTTTYTTCRGLLAQWHTYVQEGEEAEAADLAQALREQPFAEVLRAMEYTLCDKPHVARRLFKPPVHAALIEWVRAPDRMPEPAPQA
ncbi:hypothetical protein [Streptomyces hygroscopicus]|uniref:hypothetical protein n=1 Tax=Streptomyces hygroscopicus TaxID=1912 RepID=UPI0037B42ED6